MSRRILFVDDEPNLLMGLQRSMRPMLAVWDMEFVPSGEEALRRIALQPFDAVVTDMRMPGMSGAELLNRILEQSPQTVRIILSGESSRESMIRSIAPAHQFLSKPCDPQQLKSVLERTLALTELLQNDSLKSFISKINSIPSLPLLYQQAQNEIRSADPSASRLGEIIAQDMAMTAKILQVANSAAYGVYGQVTEPKRAVQLLGLDTIQAMVLSLGVFSAFDTELLGPQEADRLWQHSVTTGKFSKLIAKSQGILQGALDTYQSAGLLHDIGKLLMASADPIEYGKIVDHATSTGANQCVVEYQTYGCTHAEVGAYLLGIWGLPTSIVEAVAWNHQPSDSPVTEFSPLAAVHIASAIDAQLHPDYKHLDPQIDEVFLDRLGLVGRQETWMQLCRQQAAQGRPA